MRNKLLLILVLLIPIVYAQQPVQPISRTDDLIREQHEQTRQWCKEQVDSKETLIKEELENTKEVLKKEAKEVFWWDRILSFGSLAVAVFFGASVRGLLDKRQLNKLRTIEQQEQEYLKDLPEPPKPEFEQE